jgi:hypothetical protein
MAEMPDAPSNERQPCDGQTEPHKGQTCPPDPAPRQGESDVAKAEEQDYQQAGHKAASLPATE